MKTLLIALQEVYGLFVEDQTLAVLILVWVVSAVLLFRHMPDLGTWRGPLMFIGLAGLLIENVRRSAKK